MCLGPKELESHLIELDGISEFFVSIHPNAGLPNAFGGYDEIPESMAKFVKKWVKIVILILLVDVVEQHLNI